MPRALPFRGRALLASSLRREGGFTLLELMLVVGLCAALAATFFILTARPRGRIHSTALELQALVSEARAIAAATNEGPGSSGATIQVRRQGAQSIVSIYRYRPLAAVASTVRLEENVPPLRTTAEIRLGEATTFAIFISSSGHSAASPDFDVATSGTLASEPNCDNAAGVAIVLRDGADQETDVLSCEMAQLELERDRSAQ